jgi:hypothetical protein
MFHDDFIPQSCENGKKWVKILVEKISQSLAILTSFVYNEFINFQ